MRVDSPRTLLSGCLLTALLAGCADDTPTSIVLEISADPAVGALDALRLDIYDERSVAVEGRRLPPSGQPTLPGEVVLYPPAAGTLRLRLLAVRGAANVGEAAGQVLAHSGVQRRVELRITSGRLPDLDGDGIPDLIDRCPGQADPKSSPCPGRDLGPDASADGPGDGPPGDLDGAIAPDTSPDAPDTGIVACKTNTECDDNDPCTQDTCPASGLCAHAAVTCQGPLKTCHAWSCHPTVGCVEVPVKDGTTCNDTAYCTVNERCKKGKCTLSDPRDCQSGLPACKVGSCYELLNTCKTTDAPSNTGCDDGDACTQDEVCGSGKCEAPPLTKVALEAKDWWPRGDRAAVIDAQDALHVVYSVAGTELRYATNAGGSWTYKSLWAGTANTSAREPSLALQGGKLYAAFGKLGTLGLATIDVATGATTVESVTLSAGRTAITTDAAGLHIAYRRDGNLWYSHRSTTGAWTHTQVWMATGADVELSCSIAIGSGGSVHIAHGAGIESGAGYYGNSNTLRHTTNESGTWKTTVVPPNTGKEGNFPSIVILSSGTIHIAQATAINAAGGELLLATRTLGKTWSSQVLATGGKVGSQASLLAGAQNHLHLIYRDRSAHKLLYISNAKGSWSTPLTIESGFNRGRHGTLVRAMSGRLHVVCEDTPAKIGTYINFSACQ